MGLYGSGNPCDALCRGVLSGFSDGAHIRQTATEGPGEIHSMSLTNLREEPEQILSVQLLAHESPCDVHTAEHLRTEGSATS